MTHDIAGELSPLIDEVTAALKSELADGFPAQQADWAMSAMRDTILPHRLRLAADDTDAGKAAQTRLVLGDLQEVLSGKSPRERWQTIVRLYYTARLLPLSDRAFALALRRLEAGEATAALRADAAALQGALLSLVEGMRARAPQVHEALVNVISEASVDCSYVAGNGCAMSLRLGAIRAQLKGAATTCPGCGAGCGGEARFCKACGHPLVCRHCGATLRRAAPFCTQCGGRLTE